MPIKYLREPINDITTDFTEPPQFMVAPGSKEYNRAQAETQKRLHPEVKPLSSSLKDEQVFAAVKDLARRQPRWRIRYVDDQKRYLEATATTPWMRFKDDLAIEVRAKDSGCEIHMRSRSRLGRSDLGKNAQRIHDFFNDMKEVLKSLS